MFRMISDNTDGVNIVILQFFKLVHAFKRAVLNHRDSIVTQVTTSTIHTQ